MIYIIALTACYLAAFTAIYWLALARIERDYPPISACPPDPDEHQPLVRLGYPYPPAINYNEAQRLVSNMMYGRSP